MALKLLNTLGKKKQAFKAIKGKSVGLYTCGPTVYNYDHLGHAWNYTAADILRRVLEYDGYKVKHVMNITDVGHLVGDSDEGEDKMEKAAKAQHKSAWELADFYTKVFMENREKLNFLPPHVVCKATNHIKEMITLVKKLEAKGIAYKISDGMYFDISKYPKYGQLSGNITEQLKAGARIEVNPEKKNPSDFALWKFSPKNEKRQMEWDSPWGKGFPGWHIECSAMSMKYLGDSFDLHTGGEDNIFPHHESEIAQSESATQKKFVNYWSHTRFLMVDGQKMSKSLNNFYRIQDLEEKGFKPLALRYLFMTSSFRSQFNFTFDSLKSAQTTLEKLYNFIRKLRTMKGKAANKELATKISEVKNKFDEAINDDLNMPNALVAINGFMHSVNKQFAENKISGAQAKKILAAMFSFDKVLGLKLNEVKAEEKLPLEVMKLIKQREQARKNKDWKTSDKIRNELKAKGVVLEDRPDGTTGWKMAN